MIRCFFGSQCAGCGTVERTDMGILMQGRFFITRCKQAARMSPSLEGRLVIESGDGIGASNRLADRGGKNDL